MSEEKAEDDWEQLKAFDGLQLSNVTERRIAFKPLYDFFQILLREVGVTFLSFDKNTFAVYHLKTRWRNMKAHLSIIENPMKWDWLVKRVSDIRERIEHDDYYDPDPRALQKIRREASGFKVWLVYVAREYYKRSRNLTFKQSFNRMLDSYVREAEWMVREFGEETPHVAAPGYTSLAEKEPYEELKEISGLLREKIGSATIDEDLDRADLDNLITLVRIIAEIRAREDMLLKGSVCPKCGGKIVETEHEFGGFYENHEPAGFVYRVGCEKCDYYLHKESISL